MSSGRDQHIPWLNYRMPTHTCIAHCPHMRFSQLILEAKSTISKNRSRIIMAEQELAEIRRRKTNDRALKIKADGLSFSAPILEAHRYDWTRRYTSAMAVAENSEDELQVCVRCMLFRQ